MLINLLWADLDQEVTWKSNYAAKDLFHSVCPSVLITTESYKGLLHICTAEVHSGQMRSDMIDCQ